MKSLYRVSNIFIGVGIVNFTAFVIFCLMIGGDADIGFEKNGQYYVQNHGVSTRVSEHVWQWNRLHAKSLAITHLLFFAGVVGVQIDKRRQRR